jgi:hypothetical protein
MICLSHKGSGKYIKLSPEEEDQMRTYRLFLNDVTIGTADAINAEDAVNIAIADGIDPKGLTAEEAHYSLSLGIVFEDPRDPPGCFPSVKSF